jgi:6-phosphofructokinase 2
MAVEHEPVRPTEPILTVTLNPALDLSTRTARLEPDRKLRCSGSRRDPGGGGVNVTRVLRLLGVDAPAVYLAGGPTGDAYRALLDAAGVDSRPVPIAEETRQNLAVTVEETGEQYRFVLEGPTISPAELDAAFDLVTHAVVPGMWVVASGSLPPGADEHSYARLARIIRAASARFVVDSSGAALAAALEEGVDLIKPSRRELSQLAGTPLDDDDAVATAARDVVDAGQSAAVLVSLGADGVILVTADEIIRVPAPRVEAVSTIGAGDSLLAAVVLWRAQGRTWREAVRAGVAVAAAATRSEGTGLASPDEIADIAEALSGEA